jgi:ketosteroid isomerase-like protein
MANSPSQQRNVERFRESLGDWTAGHRGAVVETLTEDVEVLVPPELGNAGRFRGKDAFIEWTREWDEAWSEFDMEIERIEPVGHRHVIATIRSRGRGRGSGIEVENLIGWVLEVDDDELCPFISLQPSYEDALELARSREGL